MDYIFRKQFLQLDQGNKGKNFQYYHWAEKKRVEKEKQEYERFRKMWFDIEEEEEKDKEPKSKVKVQKEKKTSVDPEQLYHKNLQWKQTVESKIQRKRWQKREEQQREFQLLKQSKFKEPKILKQHEHKGPIKAWQERFDNYLRSKGGQDLMNCGQNDFQPKIDKNSRRITKQMIGKVEDRLIEYGEKLKEKKIEMETIYEEELQAQRNCNNSKSIESEMSDVYFRLYKDGERMNQKRNEQKSEYSFTPQINHYSNEIASKISEKRTPLYQSKFINSKVQPQPKKAAKDTKATEKGFNDFLKRNQALLSKIEKNRQKQLQNLKQKENKEINECTFTPELNPKSLKMFTNHNQNVVTNKSNEKIQNLSKIQINDNDNDEESQQKKLTIVRSEFEPNSYEKQARSTQRIQRIQRIQRLHSDGNLNILGDNSNIFIEDTDSISNLNENKRKNKMESSNSSKKYQSGDSDLFGTDRNHEKRQIENIHEELEEDSIERQRDNDWQKELNLMELQIEAMMQRTGN